MRVPHNGKRERVRQMTKNENDGLKEVRKRKVSNGLSIVNLVVEGFCYYPFNLK